MSACWAVGKTKVDTVQMVSSVHFVISTEGAAVVEKSLAASERRMNTREYPGCSIILLLVDFSFQFSKQIIVFVEISPIMDSSEDEFRGGVP